MTVSVPAALIKNDSEFAAFKRDVRSVLDLSYSMKMTKIVLAKIISGLRDIAHLAFLSPSFIEEIVRTVKIAMQARKEVSFSITQ